MKIKPSKSFRKRLLFVLKILLVIFSFLTFFTGGIFLLITSNDECNERECWFKNIKKITRNKGVGDAFLYIRKLYDEKEEFKLDCHDAAHLVGQEAHGLYSRNINIFFDGRMSECGSGFYHGLMREMLMQKGNYKNINDFCDYLALQSKDAMRKHAIKVACFHGVGHGLLEIEIEKKKPGSYSLNEIIGILIPKCEAVSENEIYRARCMSGVFNSIILISQNPEYMLKFDKNNPYLICGTQEDKAYVKQPCYHQMNSFFVADRDSWSYEEAIETALNIKDLSYRKEAITGIMLFAAKDVLLLNMSGNTVRDYCLRFSDIDLKSACIEGFVSGLFEFGKPSEEYQRPIEFCSSIDDRFLQEKCFKFLIQLIPYNYNQELHREICNKLTSIYVRYCESELIQR